MVVDSVLSAFLELTVGAIGGAAGTLVTMRTRFEMMARDIKDETLARKRLEQNVAEQFATIERRSLELLRMTAAIARKIGVDERFDDALVRMLAE